MRRCAAVAVVVLGLAGCGSGPDERRAASDEVERCVERLLARAEIPAEHVEASRRYAEDMYCAPFAERGWVYGDGALAIGAYEWLEAAGTCVRAGVGEPGETVPCQELESPSGRRELECAVLRHVRKSEVEAYVERLREDGEEVACDDGTPLFELGAP